MKAVVKTKPVEGYEFVTMPIPEPKEDEVLIKVSRVSICGSDVNLYKWNDVAKVIAAIPFTPGHEACGTVAKIGSRVNRMAFPIGCRVAVENHFYCGKCYQCLNDMPHICAKMAQYGHGKGTIHGGFSEYSIVPARYLYRTQTNISDEEACLLEPFGVAHQACETIGIGNDTVVVTGCGTVGLCAIAIAKYMGATKVIAADIVPLKLDLARKMGADLAVDSRKLHEVVMRETKGDGIGCVIECSGAKPLVNGGIYSILRKGGRVLMLGLPKQALHIDNPLTNVIFKSITIKTIHGRFIFHTWQEAEKILASGKIDLSPIVSHHYPLEKWQEAHKTLLTGKALKIMVSVGAQKLSETISRSFSKL